MSTDSGRSHAFKARVIALIVALVLILIVLAQNSGAVTFRFLFWRAEVSQLLLVLIVMAAGFVAGYMSALLRARRDGKTADPRPQARA